MLSGEYLRRRREEAGHSLRSLAAKGDMNHSHLADVEKERKRPTPEIRALYLGLRRGERR